MADLAYESVDVLIYDPSADSRSVLRAALNALGFRHVDSVSRLDDFASIISYRHPDIVFCEIDTDNAEICKHIRSLRWGEAGYNPFTIIVVTCWNKSESLLQHVIDAGADDVILRPFSQGSLAERLEMLTLHRKGFIVSQDYIGPDRRFSRDIDPEAQFTPPNTLHMKAAEKLSVQAADKRLNQELPQARMHVASEKLRVNAFQLGILFRFLRDGSPDGAPPDSITAQMAVALQTLDHEGKVIKLKDLCQWSTQAYHALSMMQGGPLREKDLDFLERSVKKIHRLVRADTPEQVYEAALDAAVSNIRARHQKAAKTTQKSLQAQAN